MNLTPKWTDFFKKNNIAAVHWSKIGKGDEKDSFIANWAVKNKHIIFTHDLDFGAILAFTKAKAPSVIQVRTQEVLPQHIGKLVVSSIQDYKDLLESGALLVIDKTVNRLRILPLK